VLYVTQINPLPENCMCEDDWLRVDLPNDRLRHIIIQLYTWVWTTTPGTLVFQPWRIPRLLCFLRISFQY
jgi:hypothetical protein